MAESYREITGQTTGRGWPVAEALGWLSVGLGLAALLAPRKVAEISGLDDYPHWLRLVGARALCSGAGLLTQPAKEAWLWSRVAGDVMDLALLAAGHTRTAAGRSRAIGAVAVVAAIAAADVAASVQTSRSRRASVTRSDIFIDRTLVVNKSPRECYDFWRDLRNIPRFTRRLEKVTPLDERRSQWSMRAPGGANLEWIAQIIEDEPGERLRWRSLEGAPFRHAVGRIDPSFVVSHRLPLDEAPRGYRIFRDKQEECIKVVLKPGRANIGAPPVHAH